MTTEYATLMQEMQKISAGITQNNLYVKRQLAQQSAQIAKHGSQLSKLAPLINSVKPLLRLAGIALNILGLIEQVGQFLVFAKRLEALDTRTDLIEQGISDTFSKTIQKIQTLQRQSETLDGKIDKTQQQVDANADEIASMNRTIFRLDDEVKEANTKATRALEGIVVIKNIATLQTQKITAVNSKASTALRQNTTQSQQITELQKQQKSLNVDLTEAKTRIKEGIKEDKKQDQKLQQINNEINGLKKANPGIDEIKNQIQKLNELLKQTDTKATTALEKAAQPGPKGDKGDRGERGATGATGATGAPGRDGKDGKDGKDVDNATVKKIQSQLKTIAENTTPIGLMAVALSGLKNDVKNMPSSEAFKTGVASGTCRTLQPGGCMRKGLDDLGGGINRNGSKLDKVNAALNTLDTAGTGVLLTKMDDALKRLGPAIPNGGISGRLGKMLDLGKRTWDFLQIDRVLQVLTYVTALHNAYFLSSSLGSTLFSAFSNVLAAIGIKDSEDQPLNVGEIVGNWTENFFKSIFGVATVDGIKAEWKKASRVYQAASNIIWSVQSIFDSSRSLLDLAIENTGKIGNALRKAGVVLENAYGPLVERATARNRFHKGLDDFTNGVSGVENVISNIDSAASEVLSIQETVGQINEQRAEFQQSVDAFKSNESTKENQSKTASAAPQL